jgi:hypothetical protein
MKHLADNVFEVPMPPELGVIMEMTLAVCWVVLFSILFIVFWQFSKS